MQDNTLKLADIAEVKQAIAEAPERALSLAPEPPVEDGGYLIGTQDQADSVAPPAVEYAGTRTPQRNSDVQQAMRETRRKMVLDLANVLYLNESGSILKSRSFDKSDVSCQKYIRMAEAAFDWMIKR